MLDKKEKERKKTVEKIDELSSSLTKMRKELANAKFIDSVITVCGENKFGLNNGLVDLNRDILMKLIKIIEDREKIRKLIGMMQTFYKWSKLRIFSWARYAQLSTLSDYRRVIDEWLDGPKRFRLLYKATRDGFGAECFHGMCDNKGPTVVIITSSEGYLFGGYAAVSWKSGIEELENIADVSGQSFVFSLKNPRNAAPEKFKLVRREGAISSYGSYWGPRFGGDDSADISCYENCNTENIMNYTSLGRYYSNTTGLVGTIVFTGQKNFIAKDIEVYEI